MKMIVIPFVIGAFGTIPKDLIRNWNIKKSDDEQRHKVYNTVKIGQNTELSSGDLKRLVVT